MTASLAESGLTQACMADGVSYPSHSSACTTEQALPFKAAIFFCT